MPRISNETTFGSRIFTTIRPQNGNVPAMLRLKDDTLSLGERTVISIGASQSAVEDRTVAVGNVTIARPRIDEEGNALPSDRVVIKTRSAGADDATLLADVRAFVNSDLFEQALAGEEQF